MNFVFLGCGYFTRIALVATGPCYSPFLLLPRECVMQMEGIRIGMVESSAHSFEMNSVACFVRLTPCSALPSLSPAHQHCEVGSRYHLWFPEKQEPSLCVRERSIHFGDLPLCPAPPSFPLHTNLVVLLLKTCLRERGERGRTASTEPSSVVCGAARRQREPSPGSRRLIQEKAKQLARGERSGNGNCRHD